MALAAYHDAFVDYVVYTGMTENYPEWFREEVLDDIVMDASRYTSWIPRGERPVDYYEKEVIEEYSVFIRKLDGDIQITDQITFGELYHTFHWTNFTNSGVAAFQDDMIEYVECLPGVLPFESPDWFYEYFTEAANLVDEETIFWNDSFNVTTETSGLIVATETDEEYTEGDIVVDQHCVFLRNHIGSIMFLPWERFAKEFSPGPIVDISSLKNDDVSIAKRWSYGVREI